MELARRRRRVRALAQWRACYRAARSEAERQRVLEKIDRVAPLISREAFVKSAKLTRG